MRVLVISDIHANLTALEAVLADAGPVDETWCLGDVVGYGPDPNLVVERIKQIPNFTCILGNHDVAVLGQMDYAVFNTDARRSLLWQKQNLTQPNLFYLENLSKDRLVRGNVTLVHGSPRDPVWEYILNTLAARLNFEAFSSFYCFVGHTHLQSIFQLDLSIDRVSQIVPQPGQVIQLSPRAIINPGSVGQPRDRDPRSSYAIYDSENSTWQLRRVAYDIGAVQARIRAAGLPDKHAVRLAEGW
ncbi:MAG: metallophosphoesterase family protein [Chloroflexi bacterium]|nr:metallophosphoesterase family protein [Chloroflexota bacterium]